MSNIPLYGQGKVKTEAFPTIVSDLICVYPMYVPSIIKDGTVLAFFCTRWPILAVPWISR